MAGARAIAARPYNPEVPAFWGCARTTTERLRGLSSQPVPGGFTCASASPTGMSVAATRARIATPRPTSTQTGHPVIRSFEPGESWIWCFVDELDFEDA